MTEPPCITASIAGIVFQAGGSFTGVTLTAKTLERVNNPCSFVQLTVKFSQPVQFFSVVWNETNVPLSMAIIPPSGTGPAIWYESGSAGVLMSLKCRERLMALWALVSSEKLISGTGRHKLGG